MNLFLIDKVNQSMNTFPFLIRNLPNDKRKEYYQKNIHISLNKENLSLREENNELKYFVPLDIQLLFF